MVQGGGGLFSLTITRCGPFPARDGGFVLAIGKDGWFARFVVEAVAQDLAQAVRCATNAVRGVQVRMECRSGTGKPVDQIGDP